MKTHKSLLAAFLAATAGITHAATDLSNSIDTYTGNSQADFPAQPAFLASSGLDVSFVWAGGAGAWEKIDFFPAVPDPTPQFRGAKFGANSGGGPAAGRNYLRTVETDYHTKDFTAFVTVRRAAASSSVFFGMGTAQLGLFKAPDVETNNAAAFLELQSGFPNASRRVTGDSINNEVGYNPLNQTTSNALRMRMQYNSTAQTVTYTLDFDHDGVTFVADQTLPTFSIATQVGEFFLGDRASIYFGGDSSVVFTDLTITTTQAPAPTPTGLQVTSVGNGTATISWPAGVSGATFSVFRSLTSGAYDFNTPLATGLSGNTYADSGLTNGTPYYYVIKQTRPGSLESASSNEVTATPAAGAITPSGVVAANGGKNVVVVDWTDLITPFDTYTVRKSTAAGGPFTIPIGGSGLTSSRFVDTAVVDGTTYYYTVTSTLAGNESAQSAVVSAASRSLEVFVDFNGAATFSGNGALAAPVGTSWNGIGPGLHPYLSDSSGPSSLTSVGLNATAQGAFGKDNGFNVGGDNVTPGSATLTSPGGFDLMTDYLFNNSGVATTYTLTGLVPGRTYDLYLYGYGDQLGQNTLFSVDGVEKQTSNPAGLSTITEGRHYTTITSVANASGEVVMSWDNKSGTDDADLNSGSAVFNGFQLVENASAVLQPLNPSTFSDNDSIVVSWDDVSGATSYEIHRSLNAASGFTLVGTATSSPYDDTSAVPGVTYYYAIKAVSGSNKSFLSGSAVGLVEVTFVDTDADGLSDADEALIGTNPNNPNDFFVAPTATVTRNAGNFDVAMTIRGAPGNYVIERSTSLLPGSWTEIPSSSQSFLWNTGTVLDHTLNLSATGLTPAPGGKEFFRAKGVAGPQQ
jgi:fibronectin type 3 domain-containing protein